MKTEEHDQKRRMSDAMLLGGGVAIGVVGLIGCMVLGGMKACEVARACAREGPTGWTKACVLVIAAEPAPVLVSDFHLGKWQDYVANLPAGWPVGPDVSRWPEMIPGSCDEIGLCLWTDQREGEDCDRLRTWPQCIESLDVLP